MAGPFGPPWVLTSLTGTNPVAGASYVLTVPSGVWYHVLAVSITLTTLAAVANRFVFAQWQDTAGNGAGASISATAQAASLSLVYQLMANLPTSGLIGSAQLVLTLPDLVAPEAWKFVVGALNLQAADQFAGIQVFFESLAYV